MKRITAILLFTFLFMLSAYATVPPNLPENNENVGNSENLALGAYIKVLQNKLAFFYDSSFRPDEKEKVYLDEFLKGGPYGTNAQYPFKILRFTALDMDGDKIPEVVLALSIGDKDYADFYEVLHYYDGKVYGHLFGIRSLGCLKTDGTFTGSGGVGNTSWNKLRFSENTFATVKLGYSRWNHDENGESLSYFVNNMSVTTETFDSFKNEQSKKEDVVWYKFSQENVKKQLSNK